MCLLHPAIPSSLYEETRVKRLFDIESWPFPGSLLSGLSSLVRPQEATVPSSRPVLHRAGPERRGQGWPKATGGAGAARVLDAAAPGPATLIRVGASIQTGLRTRVGSWACA